MVRVVSTGVPFTRSTAADVDVREEEVQPTISVPAIKQENKIRGNIDFYMMGRASKIVTPTS